MSGPKVVRIVTREEIIAICTAQLARLDAALRRWERELTRLGGLSEDEVTAARRRRDAIAALLADERFVDLQKSVGDELAFLKSDEQVRHRKAAEARERAQLSARRQQDAARALHAALLASGRDVPGHVLEAVEAAGRGRGEVAAALSAGFQLLSATQDRPAAHLSELAEQLRDGAEPKRLSDWMATQPPSPDQAMLDRIANKIDALDENSDSSFEMRLEAVRGTSQGPARALALDSLILDVDQALANHRRRRDLLERLELAQAELQGFGGPSLSPAPVEKRASVEALEAALTQVEAAVAQAKADQAAYARRQAVLSGLAALGYQVGAELSTAWVDEGRVVLRRPAQPGYGVEVSGGAAAERLQMRIVAFDDQPLDKARDRDAEVLWCGDVDKLSKHLSSVGASLAIEKSLPVGATPVKRVKAVDAHSAVAAVRAPKSRTV